MFVISIGNTMNNSLINYFLFRHSCIVIMSRHTDLILKLAKKGMAAASDQEEVSSPAIFEWTIMGSEIFTGNGLLEG